ncbi:YceI family protein [Lysobacter sp. 2RAF19]
MVDRSSRIALAVALATVSFGALAQEYAQAAGSSLQFSGTYQGDAFSGSFPGFRTSLSFDPAQPASGRLNVEIPIASATVGNEEMDPEMRGAGFFDAARFPKATYTATGFRAIGGGQFQANGTLSLRGVSKPVTLTFTWTPGAQPVLQGTAKVNRLDFGVGGGEWADTSLLPNEITVKTRVVFSSPR